MYNDLRLVCTLGTTTDDPSVLEKMAENGMSCARINTAYATLEEYQQRLDLARKAGVKSIMMDIKGPQIRVMCDDAYSIKEGDTFKAGFYNEPVHFSQDFYDDIEEGDRIYFENGTIETEVKKKAGFKLELEVKKAGEGLFRSYMGVNVPGKHLDVPYLTDKDEKVVEFSIKNKVEYIALSFSRDRKDVLNLADVIESKGGKLDDIGICLKIEDPMGVKNLEDMFAAAKERGIKLSVMIARGDMYVELPAEKVPGVQKSIIKKCKEYKIPVITATGFLDSMVHNPYPARSEVSDVANAVLDGTDGLMLSGECSNSKYPAEAAGTADGIMKEYGL